MYFLLEDVFVLLAERRKSAEWMAEGSLSDQCEFQNDASNKSWSLSFPTVYVRACEFGFWFDFTGWITRLLCFVFVTFRFWECTLAVNVHFCNRDVWRKKNVMTFCFLWHSPPLITIVVSGPCEGSFSICSSGRYSREACFDRLTPPFTVIKWAIWSPKRGTNVKAGSLSQWCTSSVLVFFDFVLFVWNQLTHWEKSCDVFRPVFARYM